MKKKATSPVVYCLYLFFGILAAIMSILWFIQLIGTTFNKGGVPVFTFFDPILLNLQQDSGLGFLSVGIYAILVLYMQGSAVKGNITFGVRIPFLISFHPMKKDRTFLNSFLFNVNIMMLSSIATTQLTVIAFPTYLASSYLGQTFKNQIFFLPFFGWVYKNRIFMAILDIIIILSIFVMIFQIVKDYLKSKKKK